jgi:hypothetical protein
VPEPAAREERARRAADRREGEQIRFGDAARAGDRALLVLMKAQDRPEIDRDQRERGISRRQKGSQRRRSVNFI